MAKKDKHDETDPKQAREEYLKDREANIQWEYEQNSSFDKYVLTLGGGTFGLTLTFIKNIIGPDKIVPDSVKWILFLGWALLVTSICFTLVSFRTSVAGFRWYIRKLDDTYGNPDCSVKSSNPWSIATGVLNVASIVSFVVGSAAIFLFVIQNL